MKVLEGEGLGVRMDLVSHPTSSPRFDRRRLVWGLRGALVGAIAGGLVAGIYAGGIVESSFAAIFGAIVGAALLGTLGLLTGLGLGEVQAPKEVVERQRRTDRVEGAVFLRVELTPQTAADDGVERRVREALRASGATSVGKDSLSPIPDDTVLESRPI